MNIFQWVAAVLALGLIAAPAGAQQQQDEPAAVDSAASGKAAAEAVQREELGRLFFSSEQRKILEAVRKGIISEITEAEIEDVRAVPVIVPQVSLLPTEEGPERGEDIRIDGFIRKTGADKTTMWINGRVVEDLGPNLAYEGIELQPGDVTRGGVVHAVDHYEKTRVDLKVGQIVNRDGSVLETLPVVQTAVDIAAQARLAAAEAAAAKAEAEAAAAAAEITTAPQ